MHDPRILELKKAAEKMAGGQFRVEVPPPRDGDELDDLGQSIAFLGEALDRRFEEARKITAITEKINAGLLLDEVLEFVYADFASVIPYDRIGFSLLENNNTVVRARWAKSKAPRMEITGGYAQAMQGSSLQQVLESGRPRIINDLEDYLAKKPASDSTRRVVLEGMRASLTCPLIALNRPVGFIFFSSMEKNKYQHAHVDTFRQIAGQLSVILEKSRLYQELLELNDLKTKFLGMAAHDLRNPLTVISAYLDILETDRDTGSHEDLPMMIGEMKNSCMMMLNMVETYLDVSAIQSGQIALNPEKVDVRAFANELHRSARILAEAKKIGLDLEVDPGVDQWTFDAHRLRQVMQNLLSNAVKYSLPGTRVILSLRIQGACLDIAVCDQGVGIAEQDIPKLFKDFSRATSRPTAGEKSYGLGLAICRRIVDLHGGEMSVKSKLGEGTTFTVHLPRI